MKRYFLYIIITCCFAVHLCAQQDTILLRINNEPVSRSEFESAYKKYTSSDSNNHKDVKEFLPLFIDDKLKIAEAKVLGLNATPEFRIKVEAYSEALQTGFLSDKSMPDISLYEESLKQFYSKERFLVMQIFKQIPQNCSNAELEKSDQLIRQLYSELMNNPEADFENYVEKYSDDKRSFEVGRMEVGLEFEKIISAMQKGDVSIPFFTPQGVHIVKVLDVKNGLSDREQKAMIRNRVKKKYRNGADSVFLQRLKDTYNYTPAQDNINELLKSGITEKTLFELDGKAYTGADFRFFAASNPKGLKRQFDDFVTKSLADCEKRTLETERPEHQLSVQEYEDALLLSEITRREVGDKAQADQAGLSAYFSVNKKKYRWSRPRFRGVVLHTRDKGIISEAKKIVKKRPFDEWAGFIEEYFNLGGVQQVQVEQGIFAESDNAYVDGLVFKKKRAESPSSYPFTAVIGKKVKGPENYNEILIPLMSDYEKFLETAWMKRLHKAYRVEINEEVLKTVNNH
ncbi:peptidylprolyl isomerase [Bacteroides sp. 51]|uniref:peptidylprolyl isomerase n=1 Tax=Bacteroides sp. 51 TaxID=2302938 RepID=UPI0013D0E5D7|nr:peptidylprolyl isomerase [Bacteroides sp. 51]